MVWPGVMYLSSSKGRSVVELRNRHESTRSAVLTAMSDSAAHPALLPPYPWSLTSVMASAKTPVVLRRVSSSLPAEAVEMTRHL